MSKFRKWADEPAPVTNFVLAGIFLTIFFMQATDSLQTKHLKKLDREVHHIKQHAGYVTELDVRRLLDKKEDK